MKDSTRKLVIANFKSNKTVKEAQDWLIDFLSYTNALIFSQIEVSIAPSFVSLANFSEVIADKKTKLTLCCQDLSQFPAGSYTGAVCYRNLKDLGIKYVILGHSERRKYFAENSKIVALKVEQAILAGLTPVVCIDSDYLDEQLSLFDSDTLLQCIFVFEPSFAIGTGLNADLGIVSEIVKKIKQYSSTATVLYGGSVSQTNVRDYLLVTDGVLVGCKSLNYKEFTALLTACLIHE